MQNALRNVVQFIGGGMLGGLLGFVLLVAAHMIYANMLFHGRPGPGAGQRVHADSPYLRVLQTCRGACDEIRP